MMFTALLFSKTRELSSTFPHLVFLFLGSSSGAHTISYLTAQSKTHGPCPWLTALPMCPSNSYHRGVMCGDAEVRVRGHWVSLVSVNYRGQ